jgi:hypothetical protein
MKPTQKLSQTALRLFPIHLPSLGLPVRFAWMRLAKENMLGEF